jgi:hypothetical protein
MAVGAHATLPPTLDAAMARRLRRRGVDRLNAFDKSMNRCRVGTQCLLDRRG